VYIIKDGSYVKCRSDEIQVGDLVKVSDDEMFAADLILLASSHDGGFCFI
jgi:magnesium-transporting ATPase (P-type)